MSDKERNPVNAGGESVTYTLRNIPAELDRVISDLAISAGKPKATFLKEFLESSFHDVIDLFSLRSPWWPHSMTCWPVSWARKS